MIILIIDDDPDEILLFQDAAEFINEKIEFIQAYNCVDAINMARQNLPDLTILDININPLDGIECLKLMKREEKFKDLPVIMFSTSFNPHSIDTCFSEKANYFFIKPYSISEIGSVLKRLISINWDQHEHVEKDDFVISLS
jgi:CheY-like chemotaxis protein